MVPMKYRALVLQLFKNEAVAVRRAGEPNRLAASPQREPGWVLRMGDLAGLVAEGTNTKRVVDVEVTEVNKLGFFAEAAQGAAQGCLGPARIFVSKSMVPEGWSYSEADARGGRRCQFQLRRDAQKFLPSDMKRDEVSADGTKVIRRDQNRLNAIGTTMGEKGLLVGGRCDELGEPDDGKPSTPEAGPLQAHELSMCRACAERQEVLSSGSRLEALAALAFALALCEGAEEWTEASLDAVSGAWSYCSASCGEGLQTRKRWVAIAAQGGVQNCDGSSEQRQSCETPCAPGVQCHWDVWQDWSECTASCGGGWHQRVRALSASSNRTECNMAAGHQEEPCRETPCVSCWSEWSTCSQSCSGLRTRRNKASCPSASQEELCNVEACDCVLSDWSEWGLCSGPCHEGQAVSKRTRTPQGQSNCGSEQLQEEKSCDCVASVVSASVTVTTTSEGPIDCVWAKWESWEACTASCGSGTHTRSRSLATHANNLGRDCAGEDRQVQSCKVERPSQLQICSTSTGGSGAGRGVPQLQHLGLERLVAVHGALLLLQLTLHPRARATPARHL
ncbi:unnamed protein product [Durusdinium trenchii]|uniref:Spondin-1 n=1 Tax=Durusdinium trenchii TaxID=1381693 RepID=A0ABP0JKX9_9DINO